VNEYNDQLDLWLDPPLETPSPDLLVADLDHTGIADPSLIPRFLVAALFRAGCPVAFDEVYRQIGTPVREILATVLSRQLALTSADAARQAVRVEEDFSERLCEHISENPEFRPMPGAEHAFAALQADGVRVAVDSSLRRPVVDALLRRLGWQQGGLIEVSVASGEADSGRPCPDSIRLAVARSGLSPDARVAKLVATPPDLMAASSAGCRWILGFTGGIVGPEILRSLGSTRIIDSLGEVTESLTGRVLA